MPFEKDPNEIGALWVKQGRKGEWMSGVINGVGVVVFPTHAKGEKAPQWRVLKAKPKDDNGDQRTAKGDLDDF